MSSLKLIDVNSSPHRFRGDRINTAHLAALLAFLLLASGCCPCITVPPAPGSGEFLGPTDFNGTFAAAPVGMPLFGGRSTFDGAIIFTNLTNDVVDDVLPGELQRATNISLTPGVHPVLLIFSHHANMTFQEPGPDPPYTSEYDEIILLVPFVQHVAGSRWHSLVVRMYLNDPMAIFFGNLYYGYAKQFANFERTDSELAVSTFDVKKLGIPLFESNLNWTGTWRSAGNAEATLSNFNDMQAILSMPLIGRDPLSFPWPDYICSYFRWDFSAAFIRPMHSNHQFMLPFNNLHNPGSWVSQGNLQSVVDGAVAVRDADLALKLPPFSCQF